MSFIFHPKAGLRAAELEDSEAGGSKRAVVQSQGATEDAGNDDACEWKVGEELPSRLETTCMPCENTVGLKHELAFIQPTVFGFPDAVDFTNYGYSMDFSCEIYKKYVPDEEEGGDDARESNTAYTSTTMLKDIVDPKAASSENERIILDPVLFGDLSCQT